MTARRCTRMTDARFYQLSKEDYMNLLGKTVTDRIRERNMLSPSTPVGVKGMLGKDVFVQENEQDRFLTVVATTDDIDCEGDIIVPSGADTSYFFANRKIFVDHRLGTEHCVGALHSANLKPNGWVCRIRIFKLPGNPLADDILTIAREAGIGVSIGFVPTAMGAPTAEERARYGKGGAEISNVIREWKWVELSIAAAPCNVSCQSMNLQSNGGKLALLDEMVTKGRIQLQSAVALGLTAPRNASPVIVPKKRIVVVG